MMTPERWKQLHDPELLSVAPYFRFSAGLCGDQPECSAQDGRAWHHTHANLPGLPCGRSFCGGTFSAESAMSLARKGIQIEGA